MPAADSAMLASRADLPKLAAAYRRDGYVRVPNILPAAVADHLARVLETGTDWRLAVSGSADQVDLYRRSELAGPKSQEATERVRRAHLNAREGFAFLYLCYPMIAAHLAGEDPGHPLHDVTSFLNGDEFLEFARRLAGDKSIRKVDAQATYYRPGDFLTLHDDDDQAADGRRRAAYTLGLSRRWRPDWGGQLAFHDANGDVSRALQPGFNVLTVFKVPRQHSVMPVAPYAGGPRLSITGWFRNDPPVQAP